MIRVLDRNDDKVVQKVITPKGDLIRYQYGIPGNPMTAVSTLSEARVGIGKFKGAIAPSEEK
jgi:hypothetical protein